MKELFEVIQDSDHYGPDIFISKHSGKEAADLIAKGLNADETHFTYYVNTVKGADDE